MVIFHSYVSLPEGKICDFIHDIDIGIDRVNLHLKIHQEWLNYHNPSTSTIVLGGAVPLVSRYLSLVIGAQYPKPPYEE